MKPLKAKVSITLDDDIVEKVRLLAEEDDRSFSQYINLVLRNYMKDIENASSQTNKQLINMTF
ncbi:MAG: ribbon-helix-helix protein, CopG family [Clostridiales bacterium]|nr:ribbon-helix-helix protein, CopG family [Clostridiales bacterium]